MDKTKIDKDIALKVNNLNFFYGTNQVVFDISLEIPRNQVTALIGPSGCGKSTFLRCLNRMNDLIDGTKVEGEIWFSGQDITDPKVDAIELRKRMGMVFQKSTPFPKTIFENVVYGLRIAGESDAKKLEEVCHKCLNQANLWDEVKDRLHESALALSGGQMQRLCIARAIAVSPDIILMDEPCSALDPKSTAKIEDLMHTLRKEFTVIIVTHNMQQASRVSDRTAFFYEGVLIEYDETEKIFTNPSDKKTEDYITGRFG